MKKIRALIGLLLVGIILLKGVTFYQTGIFQLKGNKMYSQSAILVDETEKTGFIDKAGLCLASLAEVKGKEYILITVGAEGAHPSPFASTL
ncbi:hypothetical protein [Vagococcus lutrae]|uniref:hypothetical protein n=1 Tax=Vagococcus lutrae TaxID=81947 RepID=UPI00200C2934|nr:hypothetical protein [Vagococcus lutrae]MDT2826805.1 hypothetical protein [Vagococcus lutrae]UQF24336.1 hypothetical protein M2909_04935 [Vagococcus lutrae]UQF63573.1 hypothetical protein M2908_06780 [Vagococcus lutrae]